MSDLLTFVMNKTLNHFISWSKFKIENKILRRKNVALPSSYVVCIFGQFTTFLLGLWMPPGAYTCTHVLISYDPWLPKFSCTDNLIWHTFDSKHSAQALSVHWIGSSLSSSLHAFNFRLCPDHIFWYYPLLYASIELIVIKSGKWQ